MKKILFFIAVAVIAVGCKSTKQVATYAEDEVEVTVRCAEFKTDQTGIRASASAISPNMQNAKDKAVAAARRELATNISGLINRVQETFTTSYDKDEMADYAARTKDLARIVASQKISGSYVVCDKMTKKADPQTGKVVYTSYVAVEIGNEDLFDAIVKQAQAAIADDDKLRTDFEYELYKKTFEEELEKLSNSIR